MKRFNKAFMRVYLSPWQCVNLSFASRKPGTFTFGIRLFPASEIDVRVREKCVQEDDVKVLRVAATKNRTMVCVLCVGVLAMMSFAARFLRADAAQEVSDPQSDHALIAEFRRVEVASVSDALEQLTGKRMYMSHRMVPIFTTKFAGFARTVLLRKDEGNTDPNALNGMLAAIDEGGVDSVYVMTVEDGDNIAGMGGLMGTAMAARGYAGAVIDGGVRDVAYLRKIGFPVYATGIVPSTSVHHYRFGGAQIPVTCDGVMVTAGDIVTADSDGIVIVPRTKAREVLALAQQMDFKEHSMYPVIEQMKSIVEAVKKFGRL
jgi:regulator of RNase E activity RraA